MSNHQQEVLTEKPKWKPLPSLAWPTPKERKRNLALLAIPRKTKVERIRDMVDVGGALLPTGDPLPAWKDYPVYKKFPVIPAKDGVFGFSRGEIGEDLFYQDRCVPFDLDDPYIRESPQPLRYEPLHDPHLTNYFDHNLGMRFGLVKKGLLEKDGRGVKATMKDWNLYRSFRAKMMAEGIRSGIRAEANLRESDRTQLKNIRIEDRRAVRRVKDERQRMFIESMRRERMKLQREAEQKVAEVDCENIDCKGRETVINILKREQRHEEVRQRLVNLKKGERKRAQGIIIDWYCRQLYADMTREAIRKQKKSLRAADLDSFVEAKREFQENKLRYLGALEERRVAEQECRLNRRIRLSERLLVKENHEYDLIREKEERRQVLVRKYAMRWLRIVRAHKKRADTYSESIFRIRQKLIEMVRELKAETGRVSFSTFIQGLVKLKPGRIAPIRMSKETERTMNDILDRLIKAAFDTYQKHHHPCLKAYEKQANRRRILGIADLTPEDFNEPVYEMRERPERDAPIPKVYFPCGSICPGLHPSWAEDESRKADCLAEEQLRRELQSLRNRKTKNRKGSGGSSLIAERLVKKGLESAAQSLRCVEEGSSVVEKLVKRTLGRAKHRIQRGSSGCTDHGSSLVAENLVSKSLGHAKKKICADGDGTKGKARGKGDISKGGIGSGGTNQQQAGKGGDGTSLVGAGGEKNAGFPQAGVRKSRTSSGGSSGAAERLVRASLSKVTQDLGKLKGKEKGAQEKGAKLHKSSVDSDTSSREAERLVRQSLSNVTGKPSNDEFGTGGGSKDQLSGQGTSRDGQGKPSGTLENERGKEKGKLPKASIDSDTSSREAERLVRQSLTSVTGQPSNEVFATGGGSKDQLSGQGTSRDGQESSRDGQGTSRDGQGTSRDGQGTSRDGQGTSRDGQGTSRDGQGTSRDGQGTSRDGQGTSRDGQGASRDGQGASRDGQGASRDGQGASRDGQGTSRDGLGESSETQQGRESSQVGIRPSMISTAEGDKTGGNISERPSSSTAAGDREKGEMGQPRSSTMLDSGRSDEGPARVSLIPSGAGERPSTAGPSKSIDVVGGKVAEAEGGGDKGKGEMGQPRSSTIMGDSGRSEEGLARGSLMATGGGSREVSGAGERPSTAGPSKSKDAGGGNVTSEKRRSSYGNVDKLVGDAISRSAESLGSKPSGSGRETDEGTGIPGQGKPSGTLEGRESSQVDVRKSMISTAAEGDDKTGGKISERPSTSTAAAADRGKGETGQPRSSTVVESSSGRSDGGPPRRSVMPSGAPGSSTDDGSSTTAEELVRKSLILRAGSGGRNSMTRGSSSAADGADGRSNDEVARGSQSQDGARPSQLDINKWKGDDADKGKKVDGSSSAPSITLSSSVDEGSSTAAEDLVRKSLIPGGLSADGSRQSVIPSSNSSIAIGGRDGRESSQADVDNLRGSRVGGDARDDADIRRSESGTSHQKRRSSYYGDVDKLVDDAVASSVQSLERLQSAGSRPTTDQQGAGAGKAPDSAESRTMGSRSGGEAERDSAIRRSESGKSPTEADKTSSRDGTGTGKAPELTERRGSSYFGDVDKLVDEAVAQSVQSLERLQSAGSRPPTDQGAGAGKAPELGESRVAGSSAADESRKSMIPGPSSAADEGRKSMIPGPSSAADESRKSVIPGSTEPGSRSEEKAPELPEKRRSSYYGDLDKLIDGAVAQSIQSLERLETPGSRRETVGGSGTAELAERTRSSYYGDVDTLVDGAFAKPTPSIEGLEPSGSQRETVAGSSTGIAPELAGSSRPSYYGDVDKLVDEAVAQSVQSLERLKSAGTRPATDERASISDIVSRPASAVIHDADIVSGRASLSETNAVGTRTSYYGEVDKLVGEAVALSVKSLERLGSPGTSGWSPQAGRDTDEERLASGRPSEVRTGAELGPPRESTSAMPSSVESGSSIPATQPSQSDENEILSPIASGDIYKLLQAAVDRAVLSLKCPEEVDPPKASIMMSGDQAGPNEFLNPIQSADILQLIRDAVDRAAKSLKCPEKEDPSKASQPSRITSENQVVQLPTITSAEMLLLIQDAINSAAKSLKCPEKEDPSKPKTTSVATLSPVPSADILYLIQTAISNAIKSLECPEKEDPSKPQSIARMESQALKNVQSILDSDVSRMVSRAVSGGRRSVEGELKEESSVVDQIVSRAVSGGRRSVEVEMIKEEQSVGRIVTEAINDASTRLHRPTPHMDLTAPRIALDSRENFMRELSNVQQQLDALKHELKQYGIEPKTD